MPRYLRILFVLFLLTYAPAETPEGLPGTYGSPSAQTLDPGAISVGITALGSNDASQVSPKYFLLRPGGPDTVSFQDLVSGDLQLHAALGLGGNFDFGLALPVYLNHIADPPGATILNGTAVGDLKILAKLRAPLPTQTLALALAGGMTVPSHAGQGFLPMGNELAILDTAGRGFNQRTFSADAFTELGLCLITVDLSQAPSPLPFRINASGGYLHVPSGLGGGRLLWNGSLEWLPSPRLGFYGDISSQAAVSGFKGFKNFLQQDMRTTTGLSISSDDGFFADVGAQFALSDRPLYAYQKSVSGGSVATYQARALPDMAVVVQIGWTGSLFMKNRLSDKSESCIHETAGSQGYQDHGCPDPDVDKDSICDPWVGASGQSARFAAICHGSDKCPNDPEDKDGFQDEDGCPEPDNDKDGICDPWVAASGQSAKYASVCHGSDKCPNDPEDFDGFQDEDGCPDLDNDKDGILDVRDKCPNDPEDKDGYQDEDGCPEPDNDKDGVCDPWVAANGQSAKYADICQGSDKCPDNAGPLENEGCPLPAKATADTATKSVPAFPARVPLPHVQFQGQTKALSINSYDELDSLVQVLKLDPAVHLEIRVYTDDQGRERERLQLTLAQAETIRRYFILHGVDRLHLVAKGMGSKDPIASNHTARGRRENRRVEIVRMDQ